MKLRAFQPDDLERIELQSAQQNFALWAPRGYAADLLRAGCAHTLLDDARVLACVGVLDLPERDGHVWLFLSFRAKRRLVSLTRWANRYLEASGKRRLFATTETQFPAGCRWLTEFLSFQFVRSLPAYGPDGADHSLYCRSLL